MLWIKQSKKDTVTGKNYPSLLNIANGAYIFIEGSINKDNDIEMCVWANYPECKGITWILSGSEDVCIDAIDLFGKKLNAIQL